MTRNQLQYHANKEIERTNRVRESLDEAKLDETHRANLEKEAETRTHNRKDEEIRRYGVDANVFGSLANAITKFRFTK